MNVYVYIRVSGKSQIEGDGPERQREYVRRFMETNSLVSVGEFFEQGVSGTVECMDRPEFSNMLAHCEARDVRAIVVERVDRLARDLMVQEILFDECRKRNIKIFPADRGQLEDVASNSGDPTRVLIRQVMGAIAQWDKSVTVMKLRAARERKKLETGRCGGKHPYGVNKFERATVSQIEQMRASGSSFSAISNALNAAGFPSRDGGQWNRQRVRGVWETIKKNKK